MQIKPDLNERNYWVAWSRMPRLGGRRLLALHEHFGSLALAWEAPPARLAQAEGIGGRLAAEAVDFRRGRDPAAEWAAVAVDSIQVITWLDEAYPPPLRDLADPPPVLYVLGRLPDWSRAVAIVGTRDATPYGARIAHGLARDLASVGGVIVSGVASGVDRSAHEGALEVPSGLTVGVLGCGFHSVYPAENRQLYRAIATRCALVTEFPPDVKPQKGNFPLRNRVISGLSRGVIVVEAKRKSGSLITVDHALEQGRQVFAVPGPIDSEQSEGTHDLLRQGARLVGSVQDVLEELGWVLAADRPAPRAGKVSEDPLEQGIWEQLARGPAHFDALAERAGLSSARAGSLLLVMELKGLVRSLPGQHYQRG